MKKNTRICLLLVIVFFYSIALKAQNHYSKLEKNRNIQAKGLIHELNHSGDTLILKSDKKINYLYSINKDNSRDLDFNINSNSYKLPLNKFSLGRHVIVAVQSPKRFVFVVKILKEIPIDKSLGMVSKNLTADNQVKIVSKRKE